MAIEAETMSQDSCRLFHHLRRHRDVDRFRELGGQLVDFGWDESSQLMLCLEDGVIDVRVRDADIVIICIPLGPVVPSLRQ